MMLSLVLHSTHEDHVKHISEGIIAGGFDLMINKRKGDFIFEGHFFFMITNEDDCSEKPWYQPSYDDDPPSLVPNYDLVDNEGNEIHCSEISNKRIIFPFEKQKLEQISFVIMLNVLILAKIIGEHVV